MLCNVALIEKCVFSDVPNGVYLIQSLHSQELQTFTKSPKVLPTPITLNVANSFLSFTEHVSSKVLEKCSENAFKLKCLREKYSTPQFKPHTYNYLLSLLKIESLSSKFNYDIFHVENAWKEQENSSELASSTGHNKIFTYNIFSGQLFDVNGSEVPPDLDRRVPCAGDEKCNGLSGRRCVDLKAPPPDYRPRGFIVRSNSWVVSIIVVSFLGIFFCVDVTVYIFRKISQKYVFEGDPTMTITLLVVTMFMYASVAPFVVDYTYDDKTPLYTARVLAVTLPYTASFSLMISRAVLLATMSRHAGFMSHVAGHVQLFLFFLMVVIECMWSVHVFDKFTNVFDNSILIYALAYNMVLICVLLCFCPLIMASRRNYEEGKYFTVTILLVILVWCVWLSGYNMLGDNAKDLMMCLGLVLTASSFLGVLFIPRTYLIAVAIARETCGSVVPSVTTTSSTMDVYRTRAQSNCVSKRRTPDRLASQKWS